MPSNSSEQLISDHLFGLGLRPERFPKPEMRVSGHKTPDFKVFQGSALEFYCEVKELTDADPFERYLQEAASGSGVAAQFNDGKSAINRLVRRIGQAVEKFKCVNPDRKHLNILAVVNTFDLAGADRLLELLQGFLKLENGGQYATTSAFLRDRVAQIRSEIDLYWWIDHHSHAKAPKHFWLSPHSEDGSTFCKLKKMFRMDEPSQSLQS